MRPPRAHGEQSNLPFLINGSLSKFLRELGIKNIFGNKGYFENFSREHENTDPLRGLNCRSSSQSSYWFYSNYISELFHLMNSLKDHSRELKRNFLYRQ